MDDLDRLFLRLVQSIRAEHPEYLARPFEIAELYQKLVPYRHHRRELQIDTNQDYEAAVTRLLSGERGYLVGDEGMQEFLRTELTSPNPDTTVFREFGSNHVAIAPGALEKFAADGKRDGTQRPGERTLTLVEDKRTPEIDTRAKTPTPSPAPPPPPAAPISAAAISTALETSPPEAGLAEEVVPSTAPPTQAPPSSSFPLPSQAQTSPPDPSQDMAASRFVTASDVGGKCRYCSGMLPDGRRIVFCPHCGQNLTLQRCPACSTELEMGWKFCVTCGRSVGAAAAT